MYAYKLYKFLVINELIDNNFRWQAIKLFKENQILVTRLIEKILDREKVMVSPS